MIEQIHTILKFGFCVKIAYMWSGLEQGNFQKRLLYETEQDFADVAYQFYQLFSRQYPEFPLPNSLNFNEVASHLDPRKGGSLEHGHAEKIDNSEFQRSIFDTAERLGFVNREVVEPRNEMENKLKIFSNPSEYKGDVEAVVVAGGAGETLIKRTYHALEAIRNDKVRTESLILLTGYREVAARENDLLEKDGFTPGKTEFELAQGAISDLVTSEIVDLKRKNQQVLLGGDEYRMDSISGNCSIGFGKNVEVTIIDSPFDRKRLLADGSEAKRAITEEIFSCLSQLIGDFDTGKTLYVVSHDIWHPAQLLIAQEVIGKRNGRKIVGSGPVNTNRVWVDPSGEMKLTDYGGVLGEINKYFSVANRFYQELKVENDIQSLR